MASLGKDIRTLLHIGTEILRLKRSLADVTRQENFDKAIDIRNEILRHQATRENYEILYCTSRFEDSLIITEPSN